MDIKEAQLKVDQWIKKYGGSYFSVLTNLGILVEEVGEFSSILVREFGDQIAKDGDKNMNSIEDELADILWVLLCLSNQLKIDLNTALNKNLEKKTQRDSKRFSNINKV